jgi:hypothetical protein
MPGNLNMRKMFFFHTLKCSISHYSLHFILPHPVTLSLSLSVSSGFQWLILKWHSFKICRLKWSIWLCKIRPHINSKEFSYIRTGVYSKEKNRVVVRFLLHTLKQLYIFYLTNFQIAKSVFPKFPSCPNLALAPSSGNTKYHPIRMNTGEFVISEQQTHTVTPPSFETHYFVVRNAKFVPELCIQYVP